MGKTGAAPLSREEKDAARKHAANLRRRADNEKRRRERIRDAKACVVRSSLADGTKLTPEQRTRAAQAQREKWDVEPDVLAAWITDGTDPRDAGEVPTSELIVTSPKQDLRRIVEETREKTVKESMATAAKAVRSDMRKGDQEAREFATAAKAQAPEMRSKFAPWQARRFLELVAVDQSAPNALTVRRRDDDTIEVAFGIVELRQFAVKGLPDKDVKARLTAIGKGDKALWGRKLGLFILHAASIRGE